MVFCCNFSLIQLSCRSNFCPKPGYKYKTPTLSHLMRDGGHFSPPPFPLPSPPPSLNHAAAADSHPPRMLASVIMALFLPCAGMSVVFAIYICLLWYATNNRTPEGKPAADKGLSSSELEKLPKVSGKELVMGSECAVCLDEIDGDQPARMVPGCNHGFHLQCADTWLLKHPVCPVCRTKLDHLFNVSVDSPC